MHALQTSCTACLDGVGKIIRDDSEGGSIELCRDGLPPGQGGRLPGWKGVAHPLQSSTLPPSEWSRMIFPHHLRMQYSWFGVHAFYGENKFCLSPNFVFTIILMV